MERVYLLVRRLIMMLIFSNLMMSFLGCSRRLPPPKQEDLVGEWKSSLGEIMFLHDDSTFIIKNFIVDEFSAKYFNEISNAVIDMEGRWRIYENKSKLWLAFNYYTLNNIIKEAKFKKNFYIVERSDFYKNELPWMIIDFRGDRVIYKKVK